MRFVRLKKRDATLGTRNEYRRLRQNKTISCLPSLAARYAGTCRVDLQWISGYGSAQEKASKQTREERESLANYRDIVDTAWHGMTSVRLSNAQMPNTPQSSSGTNLYFLELLAENSSLPGRGEGTRQSDDEDLLALGMFKDLDLLGLKVREELEFFGKLRQRHGCVLDGRVDCVLLQ